MIEKDTLIAIFCLRFMDDYSYRKISSDLNIHRDTVTKYISIMEKNMDSLKARLISKEKCNSITFDKFLEDNWKEYIDKIISFDHIRKKRKLTPDIMEKLSELSQHLQTTSAIEIYDYIYDNLPDKDLSDLSYSSLWRALKQLE